MGCLPVGGSWARSVQVRAGRAGGVGGGLSCRGGCPVWGLGLDFGRRGCPGAASRAACISVRVRRWRSGCPALVAVASRAVRGCWSAGQAWAAQPCARSGCPARSRCARWAALWARLHLGAAIGQAVRVARLCAAVRGLQWARLNRLQLARGREYVCNAFKRLLGALCGCGGVLVRVDTASGLEGKYGALTCGRGCFWA